MKQKQLIKTALIFGSAALFATPLAIPRLAKADFSNQMEELNETYSLNPQYVTLSASRGSRSVPIEDSNSQALTEAEKERYLQALYDEISLRFQIEPLIILEPEFIVSFADFDTPYLYIQGETKNKGENISAVFLMPTSEDAMPVIDVISIRGSHDEKLLKPFKELASDLFQTQLKHTVPKDGDLNIHLYLTNTLKIDLTLEWSTNTESFRASFENIDLANGTGELKELSISAKNSHVDTTGPDFHPNWFTDNEKKNLVDAAKEYIKTTGIMTAAGDPIGIERRNDNDVFDKPVLVVVFKDSQKDQFLRVHLGKDNNVWGYNFTSSSYHVGDNGDPALTKEELQPFLQIAEKAVNEKLSLQLPEDIEFNVVRPLDSQISLQAGSPQSDYWCTVTIENYNVEKGMGEVSSIDIFPDSNSELFAPFFDLGEAELKKQLGLSIPANYIQADTKSISFKDNEILLNVSWQEPTPVDPFLSVNYVAHFNSVDLSTQTGTFQHLGINASQLQLKTEHPYTSAEYEQMKQTAIDFAAKENFNTGKLMNGMFFEIDDHKGLTFTFENGLFPRFNSAISVDENNKVIEYNWNKF